MIVTITQCLNRMQLMAFFRKFCNCGLKEAVFKVDNLPIDLEIYESEEMYNMLNGAAEYTTKLSSEEIEYNNYLETQKNIEELYKKAKLWYNNLSKEDRDKIDVLVDCGNPRPCGANEE